MWPFKWKLSASTFSWCYLFVKILENEMWKFGRNLPSATFSSERVNLFTTYGHFHLSPRWPLWRGSVVLGASTLVHLISHQTYPYVSLSHVRPSWWARQLTWFHWITLYNNSHELKGKQQRKHNYDKFKYLIVSLVTNMLTLTPEMAMDSLIEAPLSRSRHATCTLHAHGVKFCGLASLEEVKIQMTSLRDASIPLRVLLRLLSRNN